MTALKRLVLFVEGEGDRDAVPVLVKRLLTEQNAWGHLFLDPVPMIVGELGGITKDDGKSWKQHLHAAAKRKNLGAVLLVLDGDIGTLRNEPFCAKVFAARLAEWSRNAGAGSKFSVACVFACQEFESWALACVDQLAGKPLPDGRDGLPAGVVCPSDDLERTPRDAKGWFQDHLPGGYKPTSDQAQLARLMVEHLDAVRQRSMRSFRRLENALAELLRAVADGSHAVSPIVAGEKAQGNK